MTMDSNTGTTGWETDLEQYLKERVNNGDRFFKSRHIATDLNVSPQKVGAGLYQLADESAYLDIDTWGGESDGITWHIDLKRSSP